MGEEGETTFGELLPGEGLEPSEGVVVDLGRAALERAVAGLPKGEREVIELRYGLGNEEPVTQREAARRSA